MTADYEYSFKAPNGVPSVCRIRLYTVVGGFHKGDTVVICSQLIDDDRAGMSVTNAAETIATGVMIKHQLQPMRMIWIEHYPEGHIAETLDRVTFDVRLRGRMSGKVEYDLARPKWTRINRHLIEDAIGAF